MNLQYRYNYLIAVPQLNSYAVKADWHIRIIDLFDNGKRIAQLVTYSITPSVIHVERLEGSFSHALEIEDAISSIEENFHHYFHT